MAFGKRKIAVAPRASDRPAPGVDAVLDATDDVTEHRFVVLNQSLLRIFNDARHIAERLREDGSIPLPIVPDDPDPYRLPINVLGFREPFSHRDDEGRIWHSVFGYCADDDLEAIDPLPQRQLHDLIGRVKKLNLFCQAAGREDALAVALHSPQFPPLLDSVLVASAYFAAFFDNLQVTQPFILARPPDIATFPDFPALKATFDRHLQMATDNMLEPARRTEYTPTQEWPRLGREMLCDDHVGQRFLNEIYFPAPHAYPNAHLVLGPLVATGPGLAV